MDSEAQPVAVGDAAPDIRLRDADDHEVQLAAYWQRQPTVLVFVRHFG